MFWISLVSYGSLLAVVGIALLWCKRALDTVDKMAETNRVLSLSVANPAIAARLAVQTTATRPAGQADMAKLFAQANKLHQERHAQNRAATPPGAPKPPTLRYRGPDEDIVKPETEAPLPDVPDMKGTS